MRRKPPSAANDDHWLDHPSVQPEAIRRRAWLYFKDKPGIFRDMYALADTMAFLLEKRP